MSNLRSASAVGILLTLIVAAANDPACATDYNDGGTHTISGADSNVTVTNGTTVNVVPGANITGTSIDPFGRTAMGVDASSIVNVSGGTITGGDGSHAGGNGLSASGQIDISGGSFFGGASSGFFVNRPGGQAADLSGFQSLSISGGNFTGGLGWEAGAGVRIGFSSTLNTAFISGGNFSGGNSPDGLLFGDALAVYGSPGLALTAVISGGVFSGPGNGLHLIGANVNVTDGQFDYPTSSEQGSTLNVGGGHFSGAIHLHDSSAANVTNGQISFFDLHDSALLNVTGGTIGGGSLFQDNSVVNLRGGHINAIDFAAFLSQNAVMNVYGTGLTYQNQELKGILQDGTPIDTLVVLFDQSALNLFQIPEPASGVLGVLGFVGCAAWASRYRKRYT